MQPHSSSASQRLCSVLHEAPFSSILARWDEIDLGGKDVPAIRWLCLNDRYYLLVKMLRRYDLWHHWLYARCREVEASPDGHLDIWFREAGKSSVITFGGIIQEVLRNKEITVSIFSHTKPIAKAFLAQIKREFESNQNLIATFPDILWADPQQEAKSWSLDGGITVKRDTNPKEATIEAHGLVDGQPTSRHFDLRVYDDVVVPESVSTPEQISKTTESWELSDNLGKEEGRIWVVGTRYHHADTYDSIMKRGALKPRVYPCTHDGTLAGRPVLWSKDYMAQKLLIQGDAVFSCQNLCSPLGGRQRMFDVSKLRVYEARPSTLMGYLLCDPARSKKKGSADTAMVVVGIDSAGNWYLLDGVAHKMDIMERWRWLHDLRAAWWRAPGMVGFKVGYETYGAQADVQYYLNEQRIEARQNPDAYFEITELEWPREGPGAKVDRIQRLIPAVHGGSLFVPYDPREALEKLLACPRCQASPFFNPCPECGLKVPMLTKLQRSMIAGGYEYRISQPIRRKDEEGRLYDLTEVLRGQLDFFPFGGKVDVIDALARLYDMDPRRPPGQDVHGTVDPDYV